MKQNRLFILPTDDAQFVYALTYLIQLQQDSIDDYLVVSKKFESLLYLLPFNAYVYAYEANEVTGIFDLLRFLKNKKISKKMDEFVDMNLSMYPLNLLGLFVGASKRVGFRNSFIDKFIYTNSLNLNALTNNTDIEFQARELEDYFLDHEDYLVVDVPFQKEQDRLNPDFCDLINYFDREKIFIYSHNAPADFKSYFTRYRINLEQKNEYIIIEQDYTLLELAQALQKSRGVITASSFTCALARLLGVKTLYVGAEQIAKLIGAQGELMMAPFESKASASAIYDQAFEFFELNSSL